MIPRHPETNEPLTDQPITQPYVYIDQMSMLARCEVTYPDGKVERMYCSRWEQAKGWAEERIGSWQCSR